MINKRAFTLVELLLVMVVLSVIVALSVPNFNQTLKRFELKKTAQDMVYLIRWAQSRAIQDNSEYRLVFLDELNSYQILRADSSQTSSNKKFISIPIRMGRVMRVPRSVKVHAAQAMTIYPDGTLDKVSIELEGQGGKLTVSSREQRGNVFILEGVYES